jgi:2-oxoacid:acceptor oxidoreductase gamma subunit (pyruvate/2-ketoisovalerate family)
MLEIVFYGRGGQGCLVASKILAKSLFLNGKQVQAFPAFGGERRGAPVKAFLRVDDKPIRRRSLIYKPDHALVLDETLLDEVPIITEMSGGQSIVINTKKPLDFFSQIKANIVTTIDANAIARDLKLGSPTSPIINTIMLGAHLAAGQLVGFDQLIQAIKNGITQHSGKNIEGAQIAYQKCLNRK